MFARSPPPVGNLGRWHDGFTSALPSVAVAPSWPRLLVSKAQHVRLSLRALELLQQTKKGRSWTPVVPWRLRIFSGRVACQDYRSVLCASSAHCSIRAERSAADISKTVVIPKFPIFCILLLLPLPLLSVSSVVLSFVPLRLEADDNVVSHDSRGSHSFRKMGGGRPYLAVVN